MKFGDMEPGREYPMQASSDLGDAIKDEATHTAYGAVEEQPTGADGRYIWSRLLPEFWEHFASKAKDYNDVDGFEPHKVLGVRGQFAEVWRKVWKLKNTLWDGRTLQYEGEREVLLDMIGHCFLAIAMLDTQAPPPGRLGEVPTSKIIEDYENVKRPNGETIRLRRGAADQWWPMCGRQKCIACSKATLRTVLANTEAEIIKGPADDWNEKHPELSSPHSVTAASQGCCTCDECENGHA